MPSRPSIRLLASPRLGTVLVLVWALLLVVWVVPFQLYGLPRQQVSAIVEREYFFLAVYVAVLVTTLACLAPRAVVMVRRARRIPGAEDPPPSDAPVTSSSPWDPAHAERALASAGYRRRVVGDGWVWGVRRRWSPLGSLLFHGSFFALALAVAVAYYSPSFQGSAVLSEGEAFSGGREQYEEVSVEDASALPPVAFRVASITPRFYRDVLLFTRLDAEVVGSGGGRHTVRVGGPWFTSPTTSVRIEDFGYSLELADGASKKSAGRSVYKLQAFPSGQPDSFEYQPPGTQSKYDVTVVVFGDYRRGPRGDGVRSFNLSRPYVSVTVDRLLSTGERRRVVEPRTVPVGSEIMLPEGPVRIAAVSEWGRFRVTSDPSGPWFLAAVALGLAGLAWRIVFPRTEAWFTATPSGCSCRVDRDVFGTSPVLSARLMTRRGRGS